MLYSVSGRSKFKAAEVFQVSHDHAGQARRECGGARPAEIGRAHDDARWFERISEHLESELVRDPRPDRVGERGPPSIGASNRHLQVRAKPTRLAPRIGGTSPDDGAGRGLSGSWWTLFHRFKRMPGGYAQISSRPETR